jgi:hypothetical protein
MDQPDVAVDPHATALGAKVADAVAALRRSDPATAATLLDEVWSDALFLAADDLEDVRARVACLLAVARCRCEEWDRAEQMAKIAADYARRLQDADGAAAVANVRAAIATGREAERERSALEEAQRRLSERSLEGAFRHAHDAAARADVLVGKSAIALGDGKDGTAAFLARAALDVLATDTSGSRSERLRVSVMARVCLARADHAVAGDELQTAWSAAADADETNLVATVIRAADLLGVEVGVLEGPWLAPPTPPLVGAAGTPTAPDGVAPTVPEIPSS